MINRMIAAILPYIPKRIVWIFSRKYISGEVVQDALRESEKLNQEGCSVTLDILGEYITRLEEAEQYKIQYLDVIKQFTGRNVRGNFSLKPSMFGLLLDKEVCYANIREIVMAAAANDRFVRIDMEDSTCTDDEIALYQRLNSEFPGRVGLVLQAYMRRTLDDIRYMIEKNDGAAPLNFRLCKGIYLEESSVAFQGYQEVRDHFMEDLEYLFTHQIFTGIATHDAYLVDKSIALIEKLNIPKSAYEFQMLFGVNSNLRRSIVARGYPMKVYVPFGRQWFGYCTRRLKENPHIVWHILKALFVKG